MVGCAIELADGLPGEIPCGLLVGLVNRLLMPQKGGDCYAIAEQAIELPFFMFYNYIFVVHTGGSIIHQSAPDSTDDKNK